MIITAAQDVIPHNTQRKKTDYGLTSSLHSAQKIKKKDKTAFGMKAYKTKPDVN